MFGKPKHKAAKAVAHPKNMDEVLAVRENLSKKYPDMVNKTGAWSEPRGKKAAAANGLTGANAKQYSKLSADDKAEVDRILGKGK